MEDTGCLGYSWRMSSVWSKLQFDMLSGNGGEGWLELQRAGARVSSFQNVCLGEEVTYLYPKLGLVHRWAGGRTI